MDCKLFLREKAEFFMRVFGFNAEGIFAFQSAMEVSIRESGPVKSFLIVPEGLTHKMIWAAFQKNGIEYAYNRELDDAAKSKHDRWPTKDYFFRHGGHWKATDGDEHLKDKSAKEIAENNFATMTSLEISLFMLEHILSTKSLVDTEAKSLASGSRNSIGDIPIIGSTGCCVYVGWHYPSRPDKEIRARSVEGIFGLRH